MNAGGRRHDPQRDEPTDTVHSPTLGAPVAAALDTIEAGDTRGAEAILLGVFEDGPTARRFRCEQCDTDYEWPGLLDRHRGLTHEIWEDAA